MKAASRQGEDPLWWSILIALAFLALALHRLTIPSQPYFDEVHYLPAARKLLDLIPANSEHPMFAKEVLAASITLLGDGPLGWRLPSALTGTLGLFAFGRFTWWLTHSRFASLAAMILLASGFAWYVQSRIAMLDIFAAALMLVALWQVAACLAELQSRGARWRLIVAGIAIGLAMGSKWSVVPVAPLPGLAFAAVWLAARSRPRIGLVEAALWLGLLPLVVYWLTYLPAFFYAPSHDPVSPIGFIQQHRAMIALQDSVTTAHTYQSTPADWLINRRPIWYLYEAVDGAQRGVLMLGNPLTMLAGLAALGWCAWAGLARRRYDAFAFAVLWLACILLWVFAAKPVLFYYNYFLAGTFLLGALALALDALAQTGRKGWWSACAMLAASVALFGWFYPILSAAPLADGVPAFEKWMWLPSWR